MGCRRRSGLAQIRAKSWANHGFMVMVRFGLFEVDLRRRQLLKSGHEVHLKPKAFDLLALLIAEAPRVVRKDELHQRLWPGTFVSDSTLAGLIKEVRRAIDDRDRKRHVIRTAHGVGYAFAGEFQSTAATRPVVSRWIVTGTRRIALEDGENAIGRDPASTVQLDAAGVSRRHARILITSSDAVIVDLGSTNGTMVNDHVVTKPLVLRDGDRIRVGPIVIVFRASTSPMSTEIIRPEP